MSKKLLVFAGVLLTAMSAWAQDGKFTLFLKNYLPSDSVYSRDIYVYLPPGYSLNKSTRYPVLYVHDGQNLFDPERAFMGQTWNAEKTLNILIQNKQIQPLIVVAIDNTPDRTAEYTPNNAADIYLKNISTDLMPKINQDFQTKTDRESTAIMGSSLGGLVSLYAGAKYSKDFGLIAALSPSIWWNNKSILSIYKNATDLPVKIYIDCGTAGGERPQDVVQLKNQLIVQYADPSKIKMIIQSGASHSEYYWAQRLPEALKFLFGY